MISATAAETASSGGCSARRRAAMARGSSPSQSSLVAFIVRASSGSLRAQVLDEVVDLFGAELVRDAVDDQARRALGDLLADLETVLLEGAAGRDEVDDAVGEPDQRGQLDRALDLDHLGLAPRPVEVRLGDARVLGRNPHRPEPAFGLAQALVADAGGE